MANSKISLDKLNCISDTRRRKMTDEYRIGSSDGGGGFGCDLSWLWLWLVE